MAKPEDLHEWVSFEDPDEDRTWLFDVTFLTSSWSCIFGRGCKGVLDHDATDLVQGCCSFGAHFADDDDIAHTAKMAERLTADQWQLRHVGLAQGTTQTNDEGETTTLLVDGACVFLNRPGFPGGAGCALHLAALDAGESPIDRTISSPISFPPIEAYPPTGTSPPNSSAMAVKQSGIDSPTAAKAVA